MPATRTARLLVAVASLMGAPGAVRAKDAEPPRYDHIIVVVMENHSVQQIAGAKEAVYLHKLSRGGANFVRSFGVAHPSQPNYLALFSGSTQGVRNDWRHEFKAPNLATRLAAKGKRFVGFIETGSPRKHNPWRSFAGVEDVEKRLDSLPSNFRRLPDVSFVIPNLIDDMHNGTIAQGDLWLSRHIGRYARWSKTHNSLLIVTFDEDDRMTKNQVFTVFYGAKIRPGKYRSRIDHYDVLRTIENIEGIRPLGESAARTGVGAVWNR